MKKSVFVLILLVLVSLILFLYPSKEEIILHYDDGHVKARGTIVDGLKHGNATLYYRNGKIKESGDWCLGKQEDLWKFYDNKGNLLKQINF